MTKWQPIETAPKDGTVFIAPYDDWSGLIFCKWASPEDDYNAVGGYWMDIDGSQESEIKYWIPRPEPPEVA